MNSWATDVERDYGRMAGEPAAWILNSCGIRGASILSLSLQIVVELLYKMNTCDTYGQVLCNMAQSRPYTP